MTGRSDREAGDGALAAAIVGAATSSIMIVLRAMVLTLKFEAAATPRRFDDSAATAPEGPDTLKIAPGNTNLSSA